MLKGNREATIDQIREEYCSLKPAIVANGGRIAVGLKCANTVFHIPGSRTQTRLLRWGLDSEEFALCAAAVEEKTLVREGHAKACNFAEHLHVALSKI